MSDQHAAASEFRVVVVRPNKRGPLGPYRLALAVVFALVVSGEEIWRSLRDGRADDGVLIVAAGAALFAWVLTTAISAILSSAPRPLVASTSGTDPGSASS